MPNSVSTIFELRDLNSYVSGLERAGDSFDKLAAKTVTFDSITSDIRKSLNETQKSVTDLTKTTESVAPPKPTISRYWENEEYKVSNSVKNIQRETAKVSGYSPSGRPTFVPPSLFGDAAPSVTGKSPLNIGYGESEFNTAVKRIQTVGGEAEKLGEKTDGVVKRLAPLRGYGAIFRELNLGINETEINAVTAGAAAAGIGTASLVAFGAFVAVGAAIVHVTQDIRSEAERRLKVEEAISGAINKQLLSAKDLTAEFNQQRINAQGGRDFTKSVTGESVEELTTRRRNLEARINLLPKTAFTADGKDENSKFFANELSIARSQALDLDRLIDERKAKDKKDRDDAYNNNASNFTKSQEQLRKYESDRIEKQNAAIKKRADDLEKANAKIDEIGKKATETFDGLFIKLNKDNPIANAFSEGKRELDKLKESLKNLSPSLQAAGIAIQTKLNNDNLFSSRLDNDLSVFDLRQKALDLRNVKPKTIDDTGKFFSDFIEAATKSAIAANGGSSVRFNRVSGGGFSQNSITDEITKSFDVVSKRDGSFGGFSQRNRTFADLTEREKFDFLNKDNLGLQTKLSAAFDVAGNRNALNDEQQSAIDKKIISLASGVNPEQLTDRQRELVATAAEKEATRREAYEGKAQQLRQQQANYQKNISDYIDGLKESAKTGGSNALTILLKDETENGATVKQQSKTADSSDVAAHYNNGFLSN